jgi:hypothetical protein
MQFRHIVVLFVQLHHCPGLHPNPHGVYGTKVKQITKHVKQNICLCILPLTFLVLIHGHAVSPQICTNYHVFGMTNSFVFFLVPFIANLQG